MPKFLLRMLWAALFGFTLIVGHSGNAAAAKDMETYWKDGVRFKYEKDGIKIQFGGRIQNDWLFWTGNQEFKNAYGTFQPNGSGPFLQDGTEFRRARIYISGVLYDYIIFKGQYDFAGGDADFKDVYLGVQNIPILGVIKVGHVKEPFSLEELTSSKYGTFIERAIPNAFAPGRNTGVLIQNHWAKRLTWALGVFRDGTGSYGNSIGDDEEYAITGRATALPVYSDDGKILFHLGGAFSYRNPANDTVRFRARPESHIASYVLDTRDPRTGLDMQSDGLQLYGAEAAMVFGPFSAQFEYFMAMMEGLPFQGAAIPPFAPFPYSGGGDAFFHGFYAYASMFLTGEHRPYKTSSGTFSRVKPKNVFHPKNGGWGAWEVAARVSHLDLSDGVYNAQQGLGAGANGGPALSFGHLWDYTLALNWYLNPNTRVMFNYVMSDPDPNGFAHLFNTRFQVDF